jgi:RNA 2',3'-cyclic 3'-phosphodiesterase
MTGSRAFVAVSPSAEAVRALRAIDRSNDGIRWIPDHQLHVTLRFLGDQVDVMGVHEHLCAALRHRPVSAVLGPAVDHFGRRIIQIPVSGLGSLAATLDEALGAFAPPRNEPFVGHLTLGRARRSVTHLPLVGLAVDASFIVDEIHLVRSELTAHGARHERIGTYPLAES